MQTDRQGNQLAGATAEAAELFDAAIRAFNIYRGDPVGLLDQAIQAAPAFAMARLAKAHLLALATEPAATAAARAILAEVRTMRLDEREASHLAALDQLVAGDWTSAAQALDRHSMRWPLDLVALQSGHLMDFFRANARDMRDRIARAMPHWTAEMPGRSIVQGMYAFGLEESGDYARAEATGVAATEAEPLDCWAHHAVAHVLEMQGRAADGLRWMRVREPHWDGDDNFFKVHNWWHQALCHLELADTEAALALYDTRVRQDGGGMAVDLVDASALLWRLQLSGVEVADRWRPLAAAWDAHADGRLYPFNDWHAAMAYLGAGRDADVQRLLDAYGDADGSGPEARRWARAWGRPLIEGFRAFWHGDHARAADLLHAARYIVNGFGGSHAQRDVIDWTMTEAALRAGQGDMALAFTAERLAIKPHSPINQAFLARAHQQRLAA